MSGELEHRDFEDALSAYALGALPVEENERLHEHLQECRECRAQLEWLRGAVDILPASVPQFQPPPELRERLMQVVTAEAELLRAAGAQADRPHPSPRRSGWLTKPAFGLAVACAVVAAVIVLLVSGGETTRTIQARLSPPFAGRALASVRVSGRHAELVVSRLPAPPAGHVDELWVVAPGGRPRPAGTFVVQNGSVAVAGSVRSGDNLLVTVEPGAGSTAPTTAPFIAARL